MAENIIMVRMEIKDRKVREELEGIISSVEGFRIQNSDSPLSCDLFILEIGDDLKKEFQLIDSIRTSGAVGEVFLTSSRTEPDILIQALRAGAKEFFPQPIKDEEIRDALLRFKERKEGVKSGGEKLPLTYKTLMEVQLRMPKNPYTLSRTVAILIRRRVVRAVIILASLQKYLCWSIKGV